MHLATFDAEAMSILFHNVSVLGLLRLSYQATYIQYFYISQYLHLDLNCRIVLAAAGALVEHKEWEVVMAHDGYRWSENRRVLSNGSLT